MHFPPLLFADGIHRFKLEAYRHQHDIKEEGDQATIRGDRSFMHQEVGSRLGLPFQAVLIALASVVHHVLRGINTIIYGCVTYDAKTIAHGFQDFLSAVIEGVALPILGLCAFVSPEGALDLIQELHTWESKEDFKSPVAPLVGNMLLVVDDAVTAFCNEGIVFCRWNFDREAFSMSKFNYSTREYGEYVDPLALSPGGVQDEA